MTNLVDVENVMDDPNMLRFLTGEAHKVVCFHSILRIVKGTLSHSSRMRFPKCYFGKHFRSHQIRMIHEEMDISEYDKFYGNMTEEFV